MNDAYQIDDTMSWFITGRGGSHDLKFGGQYQYVGARSTAQDNSNGTFSFRTDQPFNAGDPRTYPERLQIRVPGPLNRYQKAHFVAAFAQDKWRADEPRDAQPRAALRPRESSRSPKSTIRRSPIRRTYPVDTNNIAPRVGLTYDLSGDGRSVAARRLRPLLRQDALRADLGDPDGGRRSRTRSSCSSRPTTPTPVRRMASCPPTRCSPAAQPSTARCWRRCIRRAAASRTPAPSRSTTRIA